MRTFSYYKAFAVKKIDSKNYRAATDRLPFPYFDANTCTCKKCPNIHLYKRYLVEFYPGI